MINGAESTMDVSYHLTVRNDGADGGKDGILESPEIILFPVIWIWNGTLSARLLDPLIVPAWSCSPGHLHFSATLFLHHSSTWISKILTIIINLFVREAVKNIK